MHPLVDLHCHLDLYPDPSLEIAKATGAGAYVLSVTTTPKAWRVTSKLSRNSPRIKTALGLHPQLAKDRSHELPLFEALLPETRYVGEIGLDGSDDFRSSLDIQQDVLDRILKACTKSGGRILSLHSRGAAKLVLDHIEQHPHAGRYVLHWFTGTKGDLTRAIELGCWFSVGPAMLRSKKGKDLFSLMPKDKVLTETDGPFGTTNGQPLKPAEVTSAVDYIAHYWNLNSQNARKKITDNLRALTTEL